MWCEVWVPRTRRALKTLKAQQRVRSLCNVLWFFCRSVLKRTPVLVTRLFARYCTHSHDNLIISECQPRLKQTLQLNESSDWGPVLEHFWTFTNHDGRASAFGCVCKRCKYCSWQVQRTTWWSCSRTTPPLKSASPSTEWGTSSESLHSTITLWPASFKKNPIQFLNIYMHTFGNKHKEIKQKGSMCNWF